MEKTKKKFWVWMLDGSWEVWDETDVLRSSKALIVVVHHETDETRLVHSYEQSLKLNEYFKSDYLWRLVGDSSTPQIKQKHHPSKPSYIELSSLHPQTPREYVQERLGPMLKPPSVD